MSLVSSLSLTGCLVNLDTSLELYYNVSLLSLRSNPGRTPSGSYQARVQEREINTMSEIETVVSSPNQLYMTDSYTFQRCPGLHSRLVPGGLS